MKNERMISDHLHKMYCDVPNPQKVDEQLRDKIFETVLNHFNITPDAEDEFSPSFEQSDLIIGTLANMIRGNLVGRLPEDKKKIYLELYDYTKNKPKERWN